MPFYAVFVPGYSSSSAKGNSSFVFQEIEKSLETMQQFKDRNPRFKNFSNYEEARRFTIEGGGDDLTLLTSGLGNDDRTASPPIATADEAPRPFSAPSRPELTELKKSIESLNSEKVRRLINGNPRYLINCNGDTPTILQEGFRYNALHVAARVGHLDTLKIVLPIFRDESSEYVRRLYPDDMDIATTANRRRQLLDFYLNTPDKGFNETPLHFAAKNGFADLVEYLCSFDECQRALVNKNGQTAKNLVEESEGMADDVKQRILRILESRSTVCYVPLYRVRDEAYAPILQRPVAGFPDITLKLDRDAFITGDYRLAAFIGPVDSKVSDQLYVRWAFKEGSPPAGHSKLKTAKSDIDVVAVKRSDLHKGMERIGRRIAASGNHAWSEYWNFLRTFVDLGTDDGLKQLENYFRQKAIKQCENFNDDLQTNFAQAEEKQKHQEKDGVRRKLDFGDAIEYDLKNDSSRDSCDLFFDANEYSNDCGDQNSRRSDFDRLWQRTESEMGDGYFTPPQELTACVIFGQQPTKLDLDVFTSLENVQIDETRFPQTAAWMKMIRDYSDEERRQWVPLDSPRLMLRKRQSFY